MRFTCFALALFWVIALSGCGTLLEQEAYGPCSKSSDCANGICVAGRCEPLQEPNLDALDSSGPADATAPMPDSSPDLPQQLKDNTAEDTQSGADNQQKDAEIITCTQDSECVALGQKLNSCQTAFCDPASKRCKVKPVEDGTACDDENPCTIGETCKQGSCLGVPKCNASPCNLAKCNPHTGACDEQPVEDGSVCDDGDPCTVNERCLSGSCRGTKSICPCDKKSDCAIYENEDLCDGTYTCTNGFCEIETDTTISCDTLQPGPCETALCDPKTGGCNLVKLDDNTPCTDDNACTISDRCMNGKCVGSKKSCSNVSGPCTEGYCEPASGKCATRKLPDKTKCDDENNCTLNDQCSDGTCKGVDKPCVVAGNPCQQGFCEPNTGNCQTKSINEGKPCDDKKFCTEQDVCTNGVCGGKLRLCPTKNDCHSASCDQLQDKCVEKPKTNGSSCDDANDCTDVDHCTDGFCAGTQKPYGSECKNPGAPDGTGICSNEAKCQGLIWKLFPGPIKDTYVKSTALEDLWLAPDGQLWAIASITREELGDKTEQGLLVPLKNGVPERRQTLEDYPGIAAGGFWALGHNLALGVQNGEFRTLRLLSKSGVANWKSDAALALALKNTGLSPLGEPIKLWGEIDGINQRWWLGQPGFDGLVWCQIPLNGTAVKCGLEKLPTPALGIRALVGAQELSGTALWVLAEGSDSQAILRFDAGGTFTESCPFAKALCQLTPWHGIDASTTGIGAIGNGAGLLFLSDTNGWNNPGFPQLGGAETLYKSTLQWTTVRLGDQRVHLAGTVRQCLDSECSLSRVYLLYQSWDPKLNTYSQPTEISSSFCANGPHCVCDDDDDCAALLRRFSVHRIVSTGGRLVLAGTVAHPTNAGETQGIVTSFNLK